jgi:hypothetical protein
MTAPIEERFKQAVRSSGRMRVPSAQAREKIEYIVEPKYTPASKPDAGGCHSFAVLGPDAVRSTNTDADPNVLLALARAIDTFGSKYGFKAGHLLNAELGGDGRDPANLTILTSSANRENTSFDNALKMAVDSLRKAYEAISKLGINLEALKYGIQVDIKTLDATWTDTYPGNCISNGLVCSAVVQNPPNLEKLLGDRELVERNIKLGNAHTAMAAVTTFLGTANSHGKVDNKPS